MSAHQDWNPVVLRKHGPTKTTGRDEKTAAALRSSAQTATVEKFGAASNKTGAARDLRALEADTEHAVAKHVSRAFGLALQQARTAKGLKQKDLAVKLAVKPTVINDYESQRAVPDNRLIQKMERTLGVKLPRD
jgi:putative transcription factor|eukprot:gnl/Ergobibamus_cyprinoides/232.p1 GENE.gnl/Ergobibamus_cyprinoides/232~~gnl/Ergobibamus_cyprinoides/232.p1  ORF type:complete len:146 (+),score=52.86 gnl/Ergobibamus_cyprinoides/232:39-440(+)